MSATEGGEKKAISKKVKAKLEGGQREGKRKREKERRKDPQSSAWQHVSRKQADVSLSSGFPAGNATEQSLDVASPQFTGQKSTVRTHPAVSLLPVRLVPWEVGWHPGQKRQLWSDCQAPWLASVEPWEVINLWASGSSPNKGTFKGLLWDQVRAPIVGLTQCLAHNYKTIGAI